VKPHPLCNTLSNTPFLGTHTSKCDEMCACTCSIWQCIGVFSFKSKINVPVTTQSTCMTDCWCSQVWLCLIGLGCLVVWNPGSGTIVSALPHLRAVGKLGLLCFLAGGSLMGCFFPLPSVVSLFSVGSFSCCFGN
jgi:hypothetical protein